MADGDHAAHGDCWFRFIIDSRWITEDEILSEQALKRGSIGEANGRPWNHEVSGRLNSMTADVQADGEAFVAAIVSGLQNPQKRPKHLCFAGVAFNSPKNLATQIGNIRTGVFHTPIDLPDRFASPAHADFVTFGSSDHDLDAIRTWLQENLKVLKAAQLSKMPSVCSSSQSVTVETSSAASTAQSMTDVLRR
ncbi:hypothetical protein ACVL91_009666 [Bradyrhizobium elkanii]|uniref:Uncharacterized protein n=1 Tax=Bradyrhizobium elkanii TaxID=29448 RepID=A0A8I1YCM5_BRAEL|nr:hypothetical protein [Bradyrhizobium elkanii]